MGGANKLSFSCAPRCRSGTPRGPPAGVSRLGWQRLPARRCPDLSLLPLGLSWSHLSPAHERLGSSREREGSLTCCGTRRDAGMGAWGWTRRVGWRRRRRQVATLSCSFSAACAGGTDFLTGGARRAPGLGSACGRPRPCSPRVPPHTLGWGISQGLKYLPRAVGVRGMFKTTGSWVGKRSAVPLGISDVSYNFWWEGCRAGCAAGTH